MKKVLSILLLATVFVINAQKNDYEKIPDTFFKIFEQKGTDASIDYIYSTNTYLSGNLSANLKIKAELKKVTSMLDNYYGYEKIDEQFLGKSYLKLTYIARFKRQPIRFIFILYKPEKKWQLQQFKFDDKVSKLFDN